MNNEFWMVVGSQHLYGKEALEEVEKNAEEIINFFNKHELIKHKIVFKGLATTSEEVTTVFKDANYNDNVLGVITWMHTFSPAKMWIKGTKLLQKPLLHLATQFNVSIPWETIDMDYMNINQSAHGDREYGYINARLNKNNKIVVGHYKDTNVIQQISDWQTVCLGYHASQNVRVLRFGDNMRNVAVTDGDKIEAQIKFGWVVDYYGIGDLVAYMDKVTVEEIETLFNEYQKLYTFDYKEHNKEIFNQRVKEQAKMEIALKRFMQDHNYNALTTNFEDLHGMSQLPGLAIQRLNEQGIGFAGEGDWKTAALDRVLKVMTNNKATGFMEDYTYDMTPGKESILQAHMLEVDPTWAKDKPKIVVEPLDIGGKDDPARLIFNGQSGDGIAVSLADFGTHFKLLINEFTAITPTEEAPHLPVARVMWEPKPNFHESIQQWISEGGGHHTVATLNLTSSQVEDLAKMFNLDFITIK